MGQGYKTEDVEMPPMTPAANWLIWLVREMGYNVNGTPYPLSEVVVWAKLRGLSLCSGEVEAVHHLSKLWTAHVAAYQDKGTPPPWTSPEAQEIRRKAVAAQIRSSLRRRKSSHGDN